METNEHGSGLLASFHSEKFLASPNFSLIIPCYCEEPFLRQNILRLVHLLSLLKIEFELVFVEDKSPDETLDVLQRLSPELSALNVSHVILAHRKNRGRGAAVKSGIHAARGEIAGFIDIDLENSPDAIPGMYELVARGDADLVVGNRIKHGSDTRPLRRLSHLVYKWLAHLLLKLPVSDTEAGLKIFRREKILSLLPQTKNDHWFWDTEVVLVADAHGCVVKEHPVIFYRDKSKTSTVRLFRDSWLYLKALHAYRKQRVSNAMLFAANGLLELLPFSPI